MTRNHGDLLYPQAICENQEALPLYRVEVRPATITERLRLTARRIAAYIRGVRHLLD